MDDGRPLRPPRTAAARRGPRFAFRSGVLAGLQHVPARPGMLVGAWLAASAVGLALRLRRGPWGDP
jgi:hypothetical protein